MDKQTTIQTQLFSPYRLGGIELPNRIVVSPMSMYSSQEGYADDFHLVHLGRFALGGAGLVMMEATAVQRPGRGTDGCLGIWLDGHVPALQRITNFLHRHGSKAGLQLGHAGPKGSTQRPWHGGGPLTADDATQRKEFAWNTVSASAKPVDVDWPIPSALTEADLDILVEDWCTAARRAAEAGFDVLELHFAHGYLLHAFLSPLTNDRTDEYGGSLENRMRLPLRIAQAVRQVFPKNRPVLVRISSIDGVDIGWSVNDSISLARALAGIGIDAIVCSSGGVKLPKGHVLASRSPGFQVPFAEQIKREAGIPTVAVGMIRTTQQAEDILQQGQADLVALAREMLFNPNWAAQAALELEGARGWRWWPEPFGWWLQRRVRQLAPRPPA
ncbi:putative FMN oxidoreductase [Pusillimonas sp. T7-7]|uniref:NADH:flavin oxidoreductase/NADH oxidase n=1 Tax=Pusillimonas sp. (strain T7-7) TaxID=1007105 RepID=UPI0002084E16|nr:NADH:flavin oxidoreductase/NADH oxidase [Pusillimonas sp. T7-7]AEC21172.1 putative FMN oxidoreductase [Pusillimonas sp. T7-7]